MATRPTPADLPFATDANFAADGDTWSGSPTKANPGASRRAEGYEPDTLPAEWLNWQLNLLGQASEWAVTLLDANEEHTYQTPKTRVTVVSLHAAISADSGWSRATDPTTNHWWEHGSPQAKLTIPLTAFLRTGETLTAIKALVNPIAANTGADRMKLELYTVDPNIGTPAAPTPVQIASVSDDTTDAFQILNLNCGGLAVGRDGSNAKEYFAVLTAANEASGDRFYALEVTLTDPGPRNV